MKRPLGISLKLALGAVMAGIASYVAVALWSESRMVYPTPDRKSTFLQTYTPDVVVRPFFSPTWAGNWGGSKEALAGEGHATFKEYFQARFGMRSEEQPALMSTMSQSVVAALESSGARITDRSGSDAKGYQFKYAEGKSAGNIVLQPVRRLVEPDLAGFGRGYIEVLKSPGETPVEVAMSIEETWTK